MANICDNFIQFTCKELPEWLQPSKDFWAMTIIVEWESRALFLHEALPYLVGDGYPHTLDEYWHHFEFSFETRWAPPVDLYEMMIKDPNITSLYAAWNEWGCQVIWYASKDDGIVDEKFPDLFYSDVQDIYVHTEEPSQAYCDLNWDDNHILYPEYLKEMKRMKATKDFPPDVTIHDIDHEINECISELNI